METNWKNESKIKWKTEIYTNFKLSLNIKDIVGHEEPLQRGKENRH